jgi:hypothetical protein
MKRIIGFLVVSLCLFLFIGCENKPTSPETTYKFTINGVVVKDINYREDIAYFVVQRDSIPFDSAVITIEGDTVSSYGSGEYYSVSPFTVFWPKDTLDIVISCDSTTFSKRIVMPDTFHITNIWPPQENPNGDPRYVSWSGSDSASGYFIAVFNSSDSQAVGYTSLVDYNFTENREVPRTTFRNSSQTEVIPGTYYVYVVAYRESFLLYDFGFDLPGGLPTGNIDGANGTIGAGVIAPKDSIIVPWQ